MSAYIRTRQQIAKKDLRRSDRAQASCGLSAEREALETVLAGGLMQPEAFLEVHREVCSDPELQSRVERGIAATATIGEPVLPSYPGAGGDRGPAVPSATGGGAGDRSGAGLSDERLRLYLQARRPVEADPRLGQAMESGRLAAERDERALALHGSGVPMSVEEFLQTHQQVQEDPALRARVEAGTGRGSTSGAAGGGAGVTPPSGAPGDGRTRPEGRPGGKPQ